MKKIAILGCENSHANAFLKYIRDREEFADIEVVGVYSDETEAAEKLRDEFGVRVMESFDEAVGQLDGLVITARHGDNHYKYARPYMADGIPMFIDKPITVDEDEAVRFMTELRDRGIRITGGSSLRQDVFVKTLAAEAESGSEGRTLGGIVRAPLNSPSPYGGFFFYAQHLVEVVCQVFGRYPESVRTTVSGEQTTVVFRYGDFDCVGLYVEKNNIYYVCRMAEKSCHASQIKSGDGNEWYYMEFSEFYELLKGGEQTVSYKDFIAPVFIMNAIKRSVDSGKEEQVKEYTV